jgi:choline dehydrogenase-like flavoprotein
MRCVPTDDLAAGERVNQLEAALIRGHLDRRSFIRLAVAAGISLPSASAMAQQGTAISATQSYNSRNLRRQYDYVVVGAGSAGSVVARRLAENPAAQVLLLEAGGTDEIPAVLDPGLWPTNIRSERDWGYTAKPNPALFGRELILPMGKVVGGGSSINVMAWVRGHKHDFDLWAKESGDPGWGYEHVLQIYKWIEDWQRLRSGLSGTGRTPLGPTGEGSKPDCARDGRSGQISRHPGFCGSQRRHERRRRRLCHRQYADQGWASTKHSIGLPPPDPPPIQHHGPDGSRGAAGGHRKDGCNWCRVHLAEQAAQRRGPTRSSCPRARSTRRKS